MVNFLYSIIKIRTDVSVLTSSSLLPSGLTVVLKPSTFYLPTQYWVNVSSLQLWFDRQPPPPLLLLFVRLSTVSGSFRVTILPNLRRLIRILHLDPCVLDQLTRECGDLNVGVCDSFHWKDLSVRLPRHIVSRLLFPLLTFRPMVSRSVSRRTGWVESSGPDL